MEKILLKTYPIMSHPDPGQPAPYFSVPNQHGKTVTPDTLKGRPAILYFYPKDDTPGCTTQACGIRDAYREIQDTGAVLLGISPDSPASHRKFIEKHGLPFDLLADEDKAMAQAFGVWVEKSMYGRKYFGVERTTFILSPEGVVTHVFPKVKPAEHVGEVLDALRD